MPILRKLRWLLAFGLVSYLSAVVLLLLLEDRLVFHPRAGGGRWLTPPARLNVQELWLSTHDGTSIHAWWCPRQAAKSVMLFCHGNSGNLSQRLPDLLVLRDALDCSVLIFDYPGYGQSAGSPSEPGCYAAADAAYDWLSEQFPAERIVLLGQSLGGGVACDLAARRPCGGLILFKTFSSLPDVAECRLPLVPCRWMMRNRFDNVAKIGRCSAPVFMAHGARDDLIPVELARRLFDAAPQPRRLTLLANQGHHGSFERALLTEAASFLNAPQ